MGGLSYTFAFWNATDCYLYGWSVRESVGRWIMFVLWVWEIDVVYKKEFCSSSTICDNCEVLNCDLHVPVYQRIMRTWASRQRHHERIKGRVCVWGVFLLLKVAT